MSEHTDIPVGVGDGLVRFIHRAPHSCGIGVGAGALRAGGPDGVMEVELFASTHDRLRTEISERLRTTDFYLPALLLWMGFSREQIGKAMQALGLPRE